MENTARNFVLQLGALGSLYLSITFLLVLAFGVIDLSFPDSIEGAWEIASAQESVRIGIAMLLVFFPTYLILTRRVNQLRRKENVGKYLNLTKWLIYLSLLIAGLTLLIDLVTVIMTFLNGEITERFIIKALTVLIVVGIAFFYYVKDAQGYWLSNQSKSLYFGAVSSAIVLIALVFGFLNIDTPTEVREMRTDQKVTSDLQDMQWRIDDFYSMNQTLPESIADIYDPVAVPSAPEGRSAYTYTTENETMYSICGEFAQDSTTSEYERPMFSEKNYNWDHRAGIWCFEREIQKVTE